VTYEVWTGDGYATLPAATSSGEVVVTPNVNGIVRDVTRPDLILLQRRDKPGEVVQGRLEVPGGRWRAGERPEEALVREVAEETGVDIVDVSGIDDAWTPVAQIGVAVARPVAVVSGFRGAYPSLHVVFACRGEGAPRPLPGETADPRWWPESEVRYLLGDEPDAFVWHSRAILMAALAGT
jgi:8-oxo-dGTP pyrophosphatase MutT (NUDIX family)